MVIVPLYDKDPLERDSVPYVTYGLIALNLLVFFYGLTLSPDASEAFAQTFGFLSSRFSDDPFGGAIPAAATLLTYMFLHAGWLHVLGNMLFLWVFGDNIEDAMGHGRFLVFYLVCGVVAGLVFLAQSPHADALLLGASGAIAGVVAAYLMLRPCAKIEVLLFVIPIAVDAYIALGAWVLMQVYHVLVSAQDGTAWWAHVGGLLAGALLTPIMRQRDVQLFQCVHPVTIIKQLAGRGGTRDG
jgi:membrane associated rhomboid family serine protease